MRKKAQKQERVEFRMDANLLAQVKLRFYSELQECVPYGAVTNYIIGLIRADMAAYQGGAQNARESQPDGDIQLHNASCDSLLRELQSLPGNAPVEGAVPAES